MTENFGIDKLVILSGDLDKLVNESILELELLTLTLNESNTHTLQLIKRISYLRVSICAFIPSSY